MRSTLMRVNCAALVLALATPLQAGTPTSVTSSTVDAGGGRSAGPTFTVTGTIGQPDANAGTLQSQTFSVRGGFWARSPDAADDALFSDGFEP